MIIECNVLCVAEEKGAISELDTTVDVWIPCAFDMSAAIAIKLNRTDGPLAGKTAVYFTDDYWICDIPFKEGLAKFKASRE